ncbi:hemerythrin family protein [Proteiniclasticum sp. BAD-10]|uniref:Hemerythrin family protein n=1 Tax=Proteiniclasticum sediminis TaxID=2804028 RepID=A0A941CNJ9_9CLOT|nr:hemerythrin family protein [Proteiniclasticum sediminis]MBR0575990.1 hemerythrin family protein [Proteiniclasticum sediminis]
MIYWKKEYEVGIPLIDEQHEKLFEIAARAYSLLKNEFLEDKFDMMTAIIHELQDYTVFHFETEENYMEEIGYRKLFSHKVMHAEFVKKIYSVDFEAMDDDQEGHILAILEMVVAWIEHHILTKDTLYAAERPGV